jgi:hypothetical protein
MQSAELDSLYQNHDDYDHDEYEHDDEPTVYMSKEDLRSEEQEIRALEDKKTALQSRVSSMEKDIEGLAR